MSGGLWKKGTWGVDVWGTPVVVPPDPGTPPPGGEGVGQPGGSGYDDLTGTSTIEMGVSMSITQLIDYRPPPPQVVPHSYYRSVMNDDRVLAGRPVSPPVVDVSVPVTVSVGLTGVPMPDLSRALPEDIDTQASLRWYTDDSYVRTSADGYSMWWYDMTGEVAWTSYGTYQPLRASDYSYLIPMPNSAEILARPAMVFNPLLGNCMNTTVSIDPVNSVDDVEFVMVVWSHPLVSGAKASTILDNGNAVRGSQKMPFAVSDSITGMRQGLSRFSGGGLLLWQGQIGFPMWWTQISTGRPVLVRVRYGTRPMLECWGPKGLHMSHHPVLEQPSTALSTNYVLGRQFGQVSAITNAGMHLMEVNYYDHALDDAEAAEIVQTLDSCYAISA